MTNIKENLKKLEEMDPKMIKAANEMLLDPNHDFSVFTNENLFQQNSTLINVKEIKEPTRHKNAVLAFLDKAYKITHHSYTSPEYSIGISRDNNHQQIYLKGNYLYRKDQEKFFSTIDTIKDIQKAYIPLKALQSELETQMSTCVNGIKGLLENEGSTMEDTSAKVADHINSFAEQFSNLPKEEISQKVKALTKEIISAQETGKDWTYPFKEACKWIFSGLGFKGDLSNSQRIDIAFGKIENDIAIKNSDKRHNNAVIDVKKNPAILQAFKSMKADKTSNNKVVNVVTAGHHKKEDVTQAK